MTRGAAAQSGVHAPCLGRVVCALDVLRPARSALRHAFELAERFGALLDVVYVHPAANGATRSPSASRGRLETAPPVEALQGIVRGITTAIAGRASLHVIEDDPVRGLLAYAARAKADVLVLGASDGSHDDRAPSTSERVASVAPCAVLTVREDAPVPRPDFRRMLLPANVDTSTPMHATGWAILLGWSFQSELELLHVLAPAPPGHELGAWHRTRRTRAEQGLERLKQHVQTRGVPVPRTTLVEGAAAACIVDHASSMGAGLILMETPSATPGTGSAQVARVRRASFSRVLSVSAS